MAGSYMLNQLLVVKLSLLGSNAEGGHLGHQSAIFGANVEAGADLIGEACAVHAANFGLLLGVESRGAGVDDGQEDESCRAGFNKRIPVLEDEGAHVGARDLLDRVGHLNAVGIVGPQKEGPQ